jgi:hypothetical protein
MVLSENLIENAVETVSYMSLQCRFDFGNLGNLATNRAFQVWRFRWLDGKVNPIPQTDRNRQEVRLAENSTRLRTSASRASLDLNPVPVKYALEGLVQFVCQFN